MIQFCLCSIVGVMDTAVSQSLVFATRFMCFGDGAISALRSHSFLGFNFSLRFYTPRTLLNSHEFCRDVMPAVTRFLVGISIIPLPGASYDLPFTTYVMNYEWLHEV